MFTQLITRVFVRLTLLILTLVVLTIGLAHADKLSFSFTDPVEDQLQLEPVRIFPAPPSAGIIDAVGLVFNFDNASGDYEIIMTASSVNPFVGGFRINLHFFNPDSGTTVDPAFFISEYNDFFLNTSTTSITLGGSDPKLLAWELGDQVAPCEGMTFVELGPCQGSLGLPDNILGFGTGVYSFAVQPPFIGHDATGTDSFRTAPPATIVVAVVDVTVDIKPQTCPNPFNCKSKGCLPVAILGTNDFDVTTINIDTLKLKGVAPIRSSFENVAAPPNTCDCSTTSADGIVDLALKFNTQDIVAILGEVSKGDIITLELTGELTDGTAIEGSDCVVIMGVE